MASLGSVSGLQLELPGLKSVIDRIDREVLSTALASKVVASEEEAIVRDALPSDFGLSNEVWSVDLSGGTANSFNNLYTPSASDRKVVGIFGVALLESTRISDIIRFQLGDNLVIDEVTLQDIDTYNEGVKVKLLKEPIIYDKGETIKIKDYINTAGTAQVMLLARVCEARGVSDVQGGDAPGPYFLGTVPGYAYTPAELASIRSFADSILVKKAVEQKIAPLAGDVVGRDVKPTDLGLSSEQWSKDLSGGTANSYNTLYNPSATDQKVFAFYGAAVAESTRISELLKFKIGDAKTKDIISLAHADSQVIGDRAKIVVFKNLIVYNKNEEIKIEDYINATGTAQVVLLGRVAEFRGTSEIRGKK